MSIDKKCHAMLEKFMDEIDIDNLTSVQSFYLGGIAMLIMNINKCIDKKNKANELALEATDLYIDALKMSLDELLELQRRDKLSQLHH